MLQFDTVVIGSGPGGYVAAIRSAQLGMRTAIIEKYPVLGGTCTNVGCIPSKAMLDSTENYHTFLHKAPKQGIRAENISIDFPAMIARNRNVVKQNTDGLNFLMKKNKIEVFYGTGSFRNNKEVEVTAEGKETQVLSAKHFIIATGSKPSSLPGITIDKERIITSTEALYLNEQPGTMIVIGGGVIGAELASAYARIGTKISLVEYSDRLLPSMDAELGKELQKSLSKLGISIHTGCKVKSAMRQDNMVEVQYEDATGKTVSLSADYCLVAVGRKAYTTGLSLEKTTIQLDPQGRILTNEYLQTKEPHIYAIGDVVKGAMLAHKAEDEAIAVMDTISGKKPHIHYRRIPGVVYTWPEVAGVGYTEEELKKEGIEYRKGKFPFLASGRARASDDLEGFVKVLSDPKYGEVLGVHIIGARAADIIAQAVLAMEFELTDVELGKVSYAHPTFSEALKEAYLVASGRGAVNM